MKKNKIRQDSLHRFIFDKAAVRGEYIHLEKSFQVIMNQHAYPEPVRKILGEALCVAGLLRAILKFDGRLTVQFHGKGKLKLLLAQCDKQLHIRGLAKWEGELSYQELMASFNDGILVIMLDSGPGKQYQGIVSWRGNSLTESIEGYFKDSEQLMTKIWLAVDEKSAVGFLLQVIPGKDNNLKEIEETVILPSWQRITSLTQDLAANELLTVDYQSLLSNRYPQDEIRIFPADKVSFKCTCSKKRSEEAVLILGQKEAEDELNNKQTLVVTCEFCNHEYIFNRSDVTHIFEKKHSSYVKTKPNSNVKH